MWEIFTFGEKPYRDMETSEVRGMSLACSFKTFECANLTLFYDHLTESEVITGKAHFNVCRVVKVFNFRSVRQFFAIYLLKCFCRE